MRNLYLIRHGKVSFADGKKRCIGRTDTPLDEEGRSQARALAAFFAEHPVGKVYASPLTRARETAELLADGRYPVEIKEDLVELDMGEWEDVPLMELDKGLTSEPMRGEGRRAGRERFTHCIEEILSETETAGEGEDGENDENGGKDVVVVAHAGVLCAYLSGLLGTPLETSRALPQPYGGFSRILVEKGERKVAELGRMSQDAPDEARCEQLWARFGTPEPVREHCRAVCEEAISLARQLIRAGVPVDIPLLTAGALLHDLMRHKKDHPGEGARCLLKEGYPLAAEIVIRHHDWERRLGMAEYGVGSGYGPRSWPGYGSGSAHRLELGQEQGDGMRSAVVEAALVYLADKYIQGTEKVDLEQRFAKSRERCQKSEDLERALETHARRYEQARAVEELVRGWISG